MRFLTLAVSGLFALAIANPAFSAPAIDDAGAAKLKQEVQDTLAFSLKMTEIAGEGLKMDGDISVIPSGSYYQVKIPNLRFDVAGGRFNIGNIVINASPTDDGGYLASAAVPTQMTYMNSTGLTTATVTIGEQKSASVWYPAINNVTKNDSFYKNIVIDVKANNERDNFQVKIDNFKIVRNLTKNADGIWSGPDAVNLDNLVVISPEQTDNILSIGRITGNTVSDQLDMAQLFALQKSIEKMVGEAAANPEDPQAVKTLVEDMMSAQSMMNGFSTALEIADVKFRFVDNKPRTNEAGVQEAPKNVSFDVAQFGYGLSLKDIKQDKGSSAVKITLDGLKTSGVPDDVAGFIPTSSNIDIKIDSLPMKKLSESFMSVIRSAMNVSTVMDSAERQAAQDKAGMEAMSALATLPMLLTEAGTKLTVNDTRVDSPNLLTSLDGYFTMTQGKMTLAFKGMDELITKLQSMNTPQSAEMAQKLTLMQMSGQNQPGPDGKSNRVYVFEMTPDGKFLLNGADMSALMGMMGGRRGGQPALPAQPVP